MPRIENTSDAQSKFLRALHRSDFGPGSKDWPSPAVLRRWMRRPGFLRAMHSIQRTLHFQADFQLSSAAAAAGRRLVELLSSEDMSEQRSLVLGMSQLMKLSHLRQRFPTTEPPPAPPVPKILSALRNCHPDLSARKAFDLVIQMLHSDDSEKGRLELDQLTRARAALGSETE